MLVQTPINQNALEGSAEQELWVVTGKCIMFGKRHLSNENTVWKLEETVFVQIPINRNGWAYAW